MVCALMTYIGVVLIYAYDNNGVRYFGLYTCYNMTAMFWHSIVSIINVCHNTINDSLIQKCLIMRQKYVAITKIVINE